MDQEVKITLPKLGESILNATVVKWFKKVGDVVAEDEPLLEVTTDKVNSEIPSTAAGVLKEIVAHPDTDVQVGEVLAIIALRDAVTSIPSAPIINEAPAEEYFSPAVIRLALDNGLSMDVLRGLKGSGADGRVSKKDVEAYLSQKQNTCPFKKQTSHEESIEKIKMSTMRKAIAENMVKSFYEAPHASLITEVDVTEIVKHIAKVKEKFFSEHGFKLTISAFIAKAIAQAVKEHPLINSSLEQDTIVIKRHVNLGIAVSVDQGILVPVIKNCQSLSLEEIARALGLVAQKARDGNLQVSDTKEGTITMTNFGMSGTLIGIPIIRYPEVGIVGIGAITKKVVPMEDDVIAVRSMIHISLTFDHRVIDGMYGCSFLNSLKKHLESVVLI